MTGYSAQAVANTILRECFQAEKPVTAMRLQRLLYFTAAEYATITGQPLIDEPFRKWPYGPVLRSVYDKFGALGAKNIEVYSRDAGGNAYTVSVRHDPALRDALRVLPATHALSPAELSRIAVQSGSAWERATGERLDHGDIAADTTYRAALGLA